MTAHQADLFGNIDTRQQPASGRLLVPGLIYELEFLSSGTERELLREIDHAPWLSELKRRVQHYGWRYDYKARRVLPSMYIGPLPAWLSDIAGILVERGWFDKKPDQAIVNEYHPGQGIAPHVDCEPCFGPSVASISLLSDVVMGFDNPSTGQRAEEVLRSRSALVLTGPARYGWRHGISARMNDTIDGRKKRRDRRVSITFRTVSYNGAPLV
jgi:alkylated DNA repair dioxygenase AlkB